MKQARGRVLLAALVGLIVFTLVVVFEPWEVAVLSAWNAAALTLITWTLLVVWWQDSEATARVATREDDSRATADLLLVSASLASLAGIAFGLVKAAREGGPIQGTLTGFAVLSVILSWLMVQVVYMLRYARLFYVEGGGVNFNESKDPDYRDFAYLAFTIGMTYQVSDTNLTSTSIRRTALHHALLSFVFGTSIIAMMINVVAGLLNR
ncbi:MAG TPA: DUF1345 domain-containing protein [Acidimicrobiales bacterium]|jgi:uncharacterized membrane protein|nr:DUF1345 domain-containing protein [Acidimicrobiales bacterium]